MSMGEQGAGINVSVLQGQWRLRSPHFPSPFESSPFFLLPTYNSVNGPTVILVTKFVCCCSNASHGTFSQSSFSYSTLQMQPVFQVCSQFPWLE
jgi:hypothetical protein